MCRYGTPRTGSACVWHTSIVQNVLSSYRVFNELNSSDEVVCSSTSLRIIHAWYTIYYNYSNAHICAIYNTWYFKNERFVADESDSRWSHIWIERFGRLRIGGNSRWTHKWIEHFGRLRIGGDSHWTHKWIERFGRLRIGGNSCWTHRWIERFGLFGIGGNSYWIHRWIEIFG